MATSNDTKIRALLQLIEVKKGQLGIKPRAIWRTNGVIGEKNINTINSIDVCVELVAKLIGEQSSIEKALEYLGEPARDGSDIQDALADLKLRVQMIRWDLEKKKLMVLERNLRDLRSEDLKTEDALEAISKDLG